MATPYQNRLYGAAWFRFQPNTTVSSLTINLSDASYNAAIENVQSLGISQLILSGNWTISRSNNTILTLAATSAPYNINFKSMGTVLNEYSNSAIVLSTTTGANGFIILETTKNSLNQNSPY